MSTPLQKLDQIAALVADLRSDLDQPQPPVTVVRTSSELATALARGGSIRLDAGEYVGNFVVSVPCDVKALTGIPTLSPLDPLRPTLTVTGSDVTLSGLNLQNGAPDRECVLVGSHTETDPAKQPHRVTFDGVWIQAGAKGGRRGLSLHGSHITVKNCRIEGFWFKGQDAQGIWINNGIGPYLIEDSHIEGSGENILVGGAKLPIGQNPRDITIRRNTLLKPQTWRAFSSSVKNSLELKAGINVLIEDNVIDGCWRDAQDGTPIVFTPRNQSASEPFVQVDHVVYRRNVVRNCFDGFGVKILGSDDIAMSQPTTSVVLEDNLFTDGWGGMQIGNASALTLEARWNAFLGVRNTFLKFYGPSLARLVYEGNVVRSGEYGIWSDDSKTVGEPSLMASVQDLVFTVNVIEQSAARKLSYPVGNRIVPAGQLDALLDPKGQMLDGTAGPRG